MNSPLRIAVIGNAGAGKTTLARRLGRLHHLPVTHIDSIQFLPGMKIRPHSESIAMIAAVQGGERWILDGYGPLDILEARLAHAERIIFIDFPLWRHYWWCTKRQVQNLWSRRSELPPGCYELTWDHTRKLYRTLWRVHRGMRPEMLRILGRSQLKDKVVFIRSYRDWRRVHREGLKGSSVSFQSSR